MANISSQQAASQWRKINPFDLMHPPESFVGSLITQWAEDWFRDVFNLHITGNLHDGVDHLMWSEL